MAPSSSARKATSGPCKRARTRRRRPLARRRFKSPPPRSRLRRLSGASRPLRPIEPAELDAIGGEALLHFGDVIAVARLDRAQHVDTRKIRPGEGAIVDDLGDIRAGFG